MKIVRTACRAVAAAVLVVALAGCSQGDNSGAGEGGPDAEAESTALSYEETLAEYKASQQKFDLPEGAEYPEDPGLEPGEFYGKSYGEGEAIHQWNCAWGKEWLAQRGVNEDRAEAAFETFVSIRDTDFYQEFYDPEAAQPVFDAAIEAAELGDPSRIESLVGPNC